MRLISPRLLLPAVLFAGVLMLSLRVHDVWHALDSGQLRASAAFAADASPSAAPAATTSATNTAAAPAAPKPDAATAALPEQLPAAEDITPGELKVLQQLAKRRGELDTRAKDLDRRADLLKVAEQRIDQKIKQMETLRAQLQKMVDQVNGTRSSEIANLAKIYETMKPQDAAAIFDKLDMPILLGVIQSMKPKSTAPIMAQMDPKKAKALTVALMKQGELPAVGK
ncbi:MAG TPA: hypothetical protein VMV79_00980 [Alphaproteobacteria bacterium]|nr:hypothetical protein [Alphaproteobacteria bacterium]